MQKTIFERSCKNLRKFEKYQKFVEKRKNGRDVRFFVGNSRCRGCFRPFLCNCMCFACKPRVLWAFSFYVRCCLFLQKFALATSKTVLQVVRIQSLEDYGKIPFFQNASSVKLQQKGTKKQPNVRLFGEFQHLPFTSDAVCFCKSLRWRLQKPFCKSCGYSRLKITVKYFFSKRFKCQIATKGYKKTAECSAVW